MKKHAAVISVLVSAFALLFGMQSLFLPSYAAENGVWGMPAHQASLQDMHLVDSVSAKIIAVLKKSSNPVALKNSFVQKVASIRYRYEFSQPNPRLHRLLGALIEQLSSFEPPLRTNNDGYYSSLTQKGFVTNFNYNEKTDSYEAKVDHLKATLTIPPSHALRQCEYDYCEPTFNASLKEGLPYNKNHIASFSIEDKQAHQTPIDVLYSLVRDKDACKRTYTPSSSYNDHRLKMGNAVYTIDLAHFEASGKYDPNVRAGGIGEVCGLNSVESMVFFFWDSYPDRYVIANFGGHEPNLSNGGLLIDFFN